MDGIRGDGDEDEQSPVSEGEDIIVSSIVHHKNILLISMTRKAEALWYGRAPGMLTNLGWRSGGSDVDESTQLRLFCVAADRAWLYILDRTSI